MKKIWVSLCIFLGLILMQNTFNMTAYAKEELKIKDGIYADDILLSGMSEKEAEDKIQDYIDSLMDVSITLVVAQEEEILVTPSQLGLKWKNPEIIEEAIMLGTQGNIVQRYKEITDLAHENKIYPIELEFDSESISTFLLENGSKFDKKAIDMTLAGNDGDFEIVEGQNGYILNIAESTKLLNDYLINTWDHGEDKVVLVVDVEQPRGTKEELMQIKDVLGTYTTSYATSAPGRCMNVENGCKKINGTILYPGDEFCTYDIVSPFTKENGYDIAGAFLKGKVIDSVGGGICQVSTTLYNAVLFAELDVTMRYNHSMVVSYVEPSMDAAISGSAGKDFRFINNLEHPVYIEGYTKNKKVTFVIYGVETREENRTLEFETEILSTTPAGPEVIYTDETKPIGYVASQGAHIGYKAKLWKIVKEDGNVVSKEMINKSTYNMSPRSATVGIATTDPNAYNQIMEAVATGNVNHVKNVAAALAAAQQPVTPEAQIPMQ